MSKQSIRGVDTVAASEESVADYLQNHPDFFERNANVLARLRVPHERGVSTVSLVERQVLVLRDKHQKLEAKVREFVDVARANDRIANLLRAETECRCQAHGRSPKYKTPNLVTIAATRQSGEGPTEILWFWRVSIA